MPPKDLHTQHLTIAPNIFYVPSAGRLNNTINNSNRLTKPILTG